jgi:hypothetical protein
MPIMLRMNNSQAKPSQTKQYPGRLRAKDVGEILGFEEHEIPILVAHRLLTPLGKPSSNAPKYFAAVDVENLRFDAKWLNKATNVVYCYWRDKNARKTSKNSMPAENLDMQSPVSSESISLSS